MSPLLLQTKWIYGNYADWQLRDVENILSYLDWSLMLVRVGCLSHLPRDFLVSLQQFLRNRCLCNMLLMQIIHQFVIFFIQLIFSSITKLHFIRIEQALRVIVNNTGINRPLSVHKGPILATTAYNYSEVFFISQIDSCNCFLRHHLLSSEWLLLIDQFQFLHPWLDPKYPGKTLIS